MRALIILAALGIASGVVADDAGSCPRDMALRAEQAATAATTWQDLFCAYSKYRACDDAAIAEGFSDATTRLLSKNGTTWREVAALVGREDAFLAFVVRHIDETVVPETLDAIEHNAKANCPQDVSRICKAILRRAADIRDRAKHGQHPQTRDAPPGR